MSNEKVKDQPRLENIYRLDGRVPIQHAIPFGLQHVLAMFVANLAPIMLVSGSAVFADGSQGVDPVALARLLQACMFIAGIGTMIQLYPIWCIGAKLPVVMGVSFSFVTTLTLIATTWNYQTMVGAIIVGGCIEGLLGLTYRYWKKIIDPIVSACVVTAIGLSLLNVGARSFGGGMYDEHFGELKYLIVGLITLITCVSFNILAKGFLKQLNVLAGLIVGYIVAIPMGLVDFSSFGSTIRELGFFSFPRLLPYKPEFHIAAIIPLVLVFLVSAAETIGDTSGVVAGGLNRDITEREISGSLAVDGFISAVSGCFGCTPDHILLPECGTDCDDQGC